jgi:hypothetical protein
MRSYSYRRKAYSIIAQPSAPNRRYLSRSTLALGGIADISWHKLYERESDNERHPR